MLLLLLLLALCFQAYLLSKHIEYVLPNIQLSAIPRYIAVVNPTCIRRDFVEPIRNQISHASFGKEFFAVDVAEATAVATAPRRTLTDEGPWN